MLKDHILITGTSGFVGQNLSTYLTNHSFLVESISLRNSDWKDHLSSDAIIHLAGKAHDLKKVSKPSDYYDANFELTK